MWGLQPMIAASSLHQTMSRALHPQVSDSLSLPFQGHAAELTGRGACSPEQLLSASSKLSLASRGYASQRLRISP